ncbi:hypothetical protein [Fodinibius sp. SL11]|uniref:hypothetical protein n=1 Tax=Fodinibius sp. SL11 TaxID=3425690 RepID=UPI003F882F41
MRELENIISSNLFFEDLYNDPRLKYSFQIVPALNYTLKAIVEEKLDQEEINKYDNLDVDDYLQIIIDRELLDKVLTDQITNLLEVIKEVRQLGIVKALNNEGKLEQIHQHLENADQNIQETKNIIQNINVYFSN